MTALRVLLLTTAVAACAWFALGVRSSHDADRVSSVLAQATTLTPQQARSADQTLHDAGVLDPDETLNLMRAEVALHAGRHAAALSIAKGVVSREPENVEAWLALEVISAHIDPGLNRLAQLRVGQLVPPVG